MLGLPSGTITFLFTDIEGSTQLLERVGDDRYAGALTVHQNLLRAAFAEQHGYEIATEGDSFFVVFQQACQAVSAAVAAQRAIAAHTWAGGGAVRVRMGLHTGTPMVSAAGYVGLDVNRAARICAAAHGGQILVSQETGRAVEAELPPGASLRDLGSHLLKDLQQPEKVFQVLHPALPAEFPPLRSLDAFANNLPRQLTSFIGREREIAEVKRLLRTTCLLTLTGTGGAGKTRLALQVARDVLEEYPDGVWLAELAALADPSLVPHTVAMSLRVREVPGRPIEETLLHYLRRKSLLLVLDNCEHLIAASSRLAEAILRSCPRLRVLATSREVLGIAGEVPWRVPSLSLPDPHRVPAPGSLTECEAVRLFVERAAAAQPAFSLSAANAASLATVVRRLDGIPLAIELAAARVTVLSVEQIAARLDDRFRLLTGGSRTGLPRHQTLRAALDWSYQLLTATEQLAVQRLSVFAGGWTLEAAGAVCGNAGIDGFEMLNLMAQLVFKSLVLMDETRGDVRYRFLETVRQFAFQKLQESGEADAARDRHRKYFLAVAEQAKPQLTGSSQEEWLDRLETENDNLRAALESSASTVNAEDGLRLAGSLARFWSVRGYIREGRERLAWALSLVRGEAPSTARADALWGAGVLARQQGDLSAARALLAESLAIRRTLGDKSGAAAALNSLGLVVREQGDLRAAGQLHEESLTIRRALGDDLGVAQTLNNLGLVARRQGDYARARTLHEESLGIQQRMGARLGVASALNNLGLVACAQGDFAAARTVLEKSLEIMREVGYKSGVAIVLDSLGQLATAQGDHAGAQARYEESLAISQAVEEQGEIKASTLNHLGVVAYLSGDYARAQGLLAQSLTMHQRLGDRLGIVESLEVLGRLAASEGHKDRASRLLASAEAWRESIGAPLPPSDRADHDRIMAALNAGKDAAARSEDCAGGQAMKEGRAMTMEQAVEYALRSPTE